jgi:hypothetical protein
MSPNAPPDTGVEDGSTGAAELGLKEGVSAGGSAGCYVSMAHVA